MPGPVETTDVFKSLRPAHREYGRTRVLIPDQIGCAIGYDPVTKIESCRVIIPDTIRFCILAAAGTGNRMSGFVIAMDLVCFQQK